MTHKDQLETETDRDVRRLEEKERNPARFVFGLMLYGGTLGLLFVVPIVCGAYLGRWIDSLMSGYSVRFTISLILLGIGVGAYNAFYFLRRRS
ncbi:MAG: AtpZ/AtpI family protein [Alphaproteobacteria bacterium]